MTIYKEEKLIVGYGTEKPQQYSAGWRFLEIETGITYLFNGAKWQSLSDSYNSLKEIEKGFYKLPDKQLNFKKSGKTLGAGNAMHVASHDGSLWYVGSSNINKTTDITGASTQGVAWDSVSWGEAKDIVVFPDDSFVVFTNTASPLHTLIWKFTDINDAAPTKVYESAHEAQWGGDFGIDSHFNGIGGVLLAGEYGNTQNSKDLLYSADFGGTWEVIKSTGASENANNTHYHDVAIDSYNGLLWAVEGDAPENSDIFFSTTWGTNWNSLERNTNLGAGYQPTTIFVFPEYVVFGQDSNAAGMARIKNPKSLLQWDGIMASVGLPEYDYRNNMEPYLEMFHVSRHRNVGGEPCYLHYSQQYGALEGVCFESTHSGQFPSRIFMTGDGGRSFHSVGVNKYDSTNPPVPTAHAIGASSLAIDANYIYGDLGNTGEIIYAEKPNWI